MFEFIEYYSQLEEPAKTFVTFYLIYFVILPTVVFIILLPLVIKTFKEILAAWLIRSKPSKWKWLQYARYPKYALFKGITVGDRSIFILLKDSKDCIDEDYGHLSYAISGKKYNVSEGWVSMGKQGYYKDNLYKRIWTFKQLLKTARLFRAQEKRAEQDIISYDGVFMKDFTLIKD